MKVKNANAKRKATAIGLTAVMSLSVIGAGISTVSAATAGSDMVGSVASDAGIAAAHCAVDKLIEVACDSTPAMKILGAAGIGVLDSLFGSVFDTGMKLEDVDDHITRSTDEIKNDIANMASDMNTFHTEKMTAFGNLSDLVSRVGIQVSLSGFDSQSNTSEACHTHFNNLIQKTYSDQISSTFASGETQEETKKLEDYKVIDKKTCEAFESITEECPFVIDNYYNMWNYLQQNKNTYNSIARLQARYCDENLDNLNTTFQLHSIRPTLCHNAAGIADSFFTAYLIGAKRHVAHHHCTFHSTCHTSCMINHLVQGDGKCSEITCHHIAGAIANQDDIHPCLIHNLSHREIV